MTKHKRSQISNESPACECGEPVQSLRHVVWECPARPPPPVSLLWFSRLPPCLSVAHLLPLRADAAETKAWMQSCHRVADILMKRPPPQQDSQHIPGRTPKDMRLLPVSVDLTHTA